MTRMAPRKVEYSCLMFISMFIQIFIIYTIVCSNECDVDNVKWLCQDDS